MHTDLFLQMLREDAEQARALFDLMTTRQLQTLRCAHEADQQHATKPESLVFAAGRLALIADVLKTRGEQP